MNVSSKDIFSVKDHVVCITGSSRGLGKHLAREFACRGARVTISSFDEVELQKTADEFKGSNLEVLHKVADVAHPDQCKALIDYVIKEHGRIDTLICNAGVDNIKPAISYSEAEWHKILDVNLKGAFFSSIYSAQIMIGQNLSGSIIFTSSIAGELGIEGLGPYSASKGGINQLVKTLAVEWTKHGIRVNGVAPGYIDNIMANVPFSADDAYQTRIYSRTLMGRRGDLNEFTGVYLFLSSIASSYVTGQVITVDGGYNCW